MLPVLGLLLAMAAWRPAPALAIPLFASQFGVSCAKCHSVVPHLNAFGAAFLAYGYRIPGVKPDRAFPISGKTNLVLSSENQGDGPNGEGLPKAIVDEVELFTAGAIGSRASYLVEQYAVDGGSHGSTRDAWVNDRLNPWTANIPLYAQAGSFTLPLPVDPETFRDTYQGYTLYEQTAGANPFNFFDSKIGLRIGAGNPLRGTNVQLFAGPGHDRQSGLSSTGTDAMEVVQHNMGPFAVGLYRYAGRRPVNGSFDRFERTGYSLVFDQWGRLSLENVLQTGWDSECGIVAGIGCSSSGGFSQLRYQFNRRLFASARYEGTNARNAFTGDGVLLLGFAPSERSRFTIEDAISRVPQTAHTMNIQFTIAY